MSNRCTLIGVSLACLSALGCTDTSDSVDPDRIDTPPCHLAERQDGDEIAAGLVVFGDNLSDTGNDHLLRVAAGNVDPRYYDGRVSNGPNWVDHLVEMDDLICVNYARVGAVTANSLGSGLLDQIETFELQFAAGQVAVEPDSIFVVQAGAVDVFANVREPNREWIDNTIGNIESAVGALVELGAQRVMVTDLLNLGLAPFYRGLDALGPPLGNPGTSASATEICIALNAALQQRLLSRFPSRVIWAPINFEVELEPAARALGLTRFEAAKICSTLLGPAFSEGLADLGLCGVDGDEDQFYFWDEAHLSTTVHQAIAQRAQMILATTANEP